MRPEEALFTGSHASGTYVDLVNIKPRGERLTLIGV